jgi:hypothetical protein
MLGEYLGELRGKIIGSRVLPLEGQNPVIEYSIQGQGTLLGEDMTQMSTTKSVASGGFYEAQGQGIIATNDGEMITWIGHGTGQPMGARGATFRGARFYRTGSPKHVRFNGLVSVFEIELDSEGNVQEKFWQWK